MKTKKKYKGRLQDVSRKKKECCTDARNNTEIVRYAQKKHAKQDVLISKGIKREETMVKV
jgi:hypothetical protein